MILAASIHLTAALIMLWGYSKLGSLPLDDVIKLQTGGHWQFLTIQGLVVAFITMVLGFVGDLFPLVKGLRNIQRKILMVALPVSVVIASIYWTLMLFFPSLILRPLPQNNPVPSSSPAAPVLARIPLSVDLALHASPVVALVIDFIAFQLPYTQAEMTYTATALTGLATAWYGSWAEYCAFHNGTFPYPFLTDNTFRIRICIYSGAALLALSTFRGLNYIHPLRRKGSTAGKKN